MEWKAEGKGKRQHSGAENRLLPNFCIFSESKFKKNKNQGLQQSLQQLLCVPKQNGSKQQSTNRGTLTTVQFDQSRLSPLQKQAEAFFIFL